MEKTGKAMLPYILPFAAWMELMLTLPATALCYAVRSAATLAVGGACLALAARQSGQERQGGRRFGWPFALRLAVGVAVGAAVCGAWIALPAWPFAEPVAPDPSPYAPSVCGWPLTIAKLVGSAFVIAPVEEVFFRSFLYRWLIRRDFRAVPLDRIDISAFLWTVLLFTLEHDRPVAAALTGILYGLLYLRCGIGSAIAAHITTNLLLGLHVIFHNAWQFW